MWIADAARAEAEALGYTVVDAESVIVTHLTETIRHHAADLLTRQDVRALLDGLKETNAAVVEEVVPDLLSVGEVQRVLQALLREGVSIRDLGAIVEAVGDRARVTRDPALLAEYARQALAPRDRRPAPRRRVAPARDRRSTRRSSRRSPTRSPQTADGEYLAMDPQRAPRRSSPACPSSPSRSLARGRRPVLLCSVARAAAPAPPLRAGASAARRLRLQRDPAGRRRGDDGRRRARRPAGRRVGSPSAVVARAMTRPAVRSSPMPEGAPADRVAV